MGKASSRSLIEYYRIKENTQVFSIQCEPFRPAYAKAFHHIRRKEKISLASISAATGLPKELLNKFEKASINYSLQDFAKIITYYCGLGYSITISFC